MRVFLRDPLLSILENLWKSVPPGPESMDFGSGGRFEKYVFYYVYATFLRLCAILTCCNVFNVCLTFEVLLFLVIAKSNFGVGIWEVVDFVLGKLNFLVWGQGHEALRFLDENLEKLSVSQQEIVFQIFQSVEQAFSFE